MPGPAGSKKKKGGNKRKGKGYGYKTRQLNDIAKDFNPESFEVYGQVIKAEGNRRFSVNVQSLERPQELQDNSIVCSIRGSYRKRISRDMFVLVKLFDFNTKQGQIIDGYTIDEVAALKANDMWDYPEAAVTVRAIDNENMLPSDSDTDSEEEEEVPDSTDAVPDDFDIDAI